MTHTGHRTQKTSAKITPLGWIGIIMAVILGGWLIAYTLPREGEPHEVHAPHWWGVGLIPFIAILAAIALLPLIPRTHHWWESNRNRLIVSLIFGALTVIYYMIAEGMASVPVVLSHAIVLDYVPFIILLFALYVISGGIRLTGDLAAHPLTNTTFLAIGAVLASFVGTTGASMLLIRPLLQTNSERKRVTHTVIFFIFLVSNVGGCLLPIGDPPLFLGYLRGVPFLWPFAALWKEWAFCSVALLVIYFVWDTFAYSHETKAAIRRDETRLKPLRLHGSINFLWLGGVVLAVAMLDSHKVVPGTNWEPFPLLREMVMLALVALSLLTTPRGLREANRFNYAAIAEVAALFIGIFITMRVPMDVLHVMGGGLGLDRPWEFFWATGSLSSFLDNAPTYVVFFETANAMADAPGPGVIQLLDGRYIREDFLVAISLGAVFMGANTYIGNGPNFMVKAIAEQSGVKMPTFFGYMLRYSLPILVPLFVLITVLFMR
jgi:Na+/H+ antiporter NhaD/arsenite permease-like protein